MNIKAKISIAIAVVLVAFGSWFYFTPHLTVRAMKSAAEAKDAEKLSGYINFPAVKESLKADFNAKLVSEAAKEKDANASAAFGAALAAAFIDPMVDALVTPESLARMMKDGKPAPAKSADEAKPADSDTEASMSYESFDRFVVTMKKKGNAEESLGLVFNRDGMFSWKLSALRLPI